MKNFLLAICLLLASISEGSAAPQEIASFRGSVANVEPNVAPNPAQRGTTNIQYQAMGRSFVMPLGQESGLQALDTGKGNNPAWQLLSAAWNQARILPYDAMLLLGQSDIGVYVAVLAEDVNGRAITAPVTERADFLSAQLWASYNDEDDFSQLASEAVAGLGILARDDNSVYALSVLNAPVAQPPGAAPAPGENKPPELQAIAKPRPTLMVSSLSVVNGLPIVIGASSNHVESVQELFSVCRILSLYLALSNELPANGFFNPDLENLIIAGRKLNLALPANHCPLRASNARQILNLLQLESASYASLYPVVAYAPCDKLATWLESPHDAPLTSYGLLGINLHEGQLQVVTDGRSFIKGLQSEQQGKALSASDLTTIDWSKAVQEMPTDAMEGIGHFGVDRRAAYWGVLLRSHSAEQGQSGLLAGVLGVGPVNGLAVMNIIYRPIEESNVFASLLQQQKNMFAGFK